MAHASHQIIIPTKVHYLIHAYGSGRRPREMKEFQLLKILTLSFSWMMSLVGYSQFINSIWLMIQLQNIKYLNCVIFRHRRGV